MNFVSGVFILFVVISVAVYYLVPRKFRWIALLASNLVFYIWSGPKTAVFLLVTTVTTYAAGLLLGRLESRKQELGKENREAVKSVTAKKKLVVAFSLLVNFGMLFVLKYLDTLLQYTNRIIEASGSGFRFLSPGIILPLGISFYIFQSVGYVIDCYRGKYPPEKNILKYTLFTTFFPQMVQGPISRFDKLGHQLSEGNDLDFENVRYGLQRIMWGYFKKMVIADRAAVIVAHFFDNESQYGGAVTAFAILMYCINLYCDFSGGIDITIGVARLFGITLDENFRRPVFARSLQEYWRRWHITLGSWMKDYVFYPISLSKPFIKLGKWARRHMKGKAGKILATSAATFIVYLLIGIWHGPNLKYIVFGFWNGIIITASLLLAGPFTSAKSRLRIRDESAGWRIFSVLRTCLIVFIGRYITRSPDVITAFTLIGRTFNPATVDFAQLFDSSILNMGLMVQDLIVIAVSLLVMLAVEFYEEKKGSFAIMLSKKPALVQWLAVLIPLAVILIFGIMRGSYISSEFIYKQY